MGDNVVAICHSSPKATVMWPTLITFNFCGALFTCRKIITPSNLFIVTCMYDTISSAGNSQQEGNLYQYNEF